MSSKVCSVPDHVVVLRFVLYIYRESQPPLCCPSESQAHLCSYPVSAQGCLTGPLLQLQCPADVPHFREADVSYVSDSSRSSFTESNDSGKFPGEGALHCH